MPKEKIKVKPIGINKQNIKNNMEKTGLIPNKSCDKKCYWKGKNLINMFYEEFLILIDYQQPSDEDIIYVPINRDRGQNQKVYTFDYLGLMIWVWRKKIRTVLIYNYEDE